MVPDPQLPSPMETSSEDESIDIKHTARSTTLPSTITPALTPQLSQIGKQLTGKKIALESPDNAARELARSLTLEEQVCLRFPSL